jgi:Na+-transporting methylmalonyl-CoA/oxaloacetate decarboxylase beta subunit
LQTLAVIRRNYLGESGVVNRLCKAAENEISNIVTLLLGERAPGIDLGFAAMQCP